MATTVPAPEEEKSGFRQPPNNLEAEMGLLGAVLQNNTTFDRVGGFLRPEHFFDPVHQRIFEACTRLIENSRLADPTTLKHYFDGPEFERIGGHRYLGELAGASFSIINAEHYGRVIHDLYLRRQLIEIGTDVVNDSYSSDPDDSASSLIENTEQHLFNLSTGSGYEGGFASFSVVLKNAVDLANEAHQRDGPAGAATRFHELDRLLGGLQKSDLIILAGRPSMGKTALATNIAFNIASRPGMYTDEDGEQTPAESPVISFFSLEMAAEQLASRVLAENAHVNSHKIRQGELNNDEFNRLVRASATLQSIPLYIDDTPALTISALRTRARRLHREQGGLSLIVVDYLQLLRASPASTRQGRVQEISEITQGLKAVAKDLNVPVLALSQLSRAVEQRDDKRPQLSDLRESGTIEQDADVVIFIYREEYYLERATPSQRQDESTEDFNKRQQGLEDRKTKVAGQAELIIAKQRHGPTGTIKLRFLPEATKFDNLNDAPGYRDDPVESDY